jgi:hypothetical protein
MKNLIIGAKEIKTRKFLEANKFQVNMLLAKSGYLGKLSKEDIQKSMKELGGNQLPKERGL